MIAAHSPYNFVAICSVIKVTDGPTGQTLTIMCIRLDKTITSQTDDRNGIKSYRALHASAC